MKEKQILFDIGMQDYNRRFLAVIAVAITPSFIPSHISNKEKTTNPITDNRYIFLNNFH